MAQRAYPYTNLTSALADASSPLREYLAAEFPHTRGLLADFRDQCGPLLVEGTSASSATVGAAFDYQTRFVLDPDHLPRQALYAFLDDPRALAALDVVIERAAAAARAPEASAELLARACWALALATAVLLWAGPGIGTQLLALLAAALIGLTWRRGGEPPARPRRRRLITCRSPLTCPI